MIETGNIRDMYYTCTDYLGNINMIIDQNRNIAQETSFDAWGRRRNTTDWSYSNITAPALVKRGFTGHEHLDEFGLINMNARLYDPFICRMLSADNVLFDATNSQNYNRYSYVLNNPLKYSDPTGNVPKGGPSASIMPPGLSHIDFYDNYEMFRANTIKQEKDEMIAMLMMPSGGDGGGNNGMVGSEGDPVPTSKATMRQTEAYMAAGIGWRGKTNGVDVSGVSTSNWGGSLNTANNWLGVVGYIEGAIGAIQLGMIDYRSSLSISSRIGTFGRFSSTYRILGLTSNAFGRAGYAGAVINTIVDYKSLQSGEISKARFGYRSIGTLGSIGGGISIGLMYGGPWGALGGAGIGLGSWAGEQGYDGYMYWQTQMGVFLNNVENGLKNGWVPGR